MRAGLLLSKRLKAIKQVAKVVFLLATFSCKLSQQGILGWTKPAAIDKCDIHSMQGLDVGGQMCSSVCNCASFIAF